MNDNGAVILPNLIPHRFAHFTMDNIDIKDHTLSGLDTFHKQQIVVWHRGLGSAIVLFEMQPAANNTLNVPEAMETLIPAGIPL
ncbi:MAG: hypothetical protein GY707_10285 [Desulfobacteraceae bacterium]|nr:hypothetical protein [Desulfobacteraceae bacterium]